MSEQLAFLASYENFKNYSTCDDNKNRLIILKFTATWCGPCKKIKPFIEAKKKEYPNNIFIAVDVDNDHHQALCNNFSVQAMPTFIFYRNGVLLHTLVGSNEIEIDAKLKELSNQTNEIVY